MKLPVLDKGNVELISSTNNGDLLVVNAARCSFDKEHSEFDLVKDTKLISYLAKHKHVLPFRHPQATIRIHAPIFVLRQLGKHQVGFSSSEVSRRYITSEPEFYEPENFRLRSKDVKQGSSEDIFVRTRELAGHHRSYNQDALAKYKNLLDIGICPEQARILLPQSMYTTTVTTGSLLGWYHMYNMRSEKHTQAETREYATAIGELIFSQFPYSWKALTNEVSFTN